MELLRKKQESISDGTQTITAEFTEARVHGWRAIHVIISILVTTIAILHGIMLFPRLASPTAGILMGAVGLGVLLVLGLSGLITENKRKTRAFGSFKKLHLWLMVGALTLVELHTVAAGSTIANMGTSVAVGLLIGTVGLVGFGVEYVSLKTARRFFNPETKNRPSEDYQVDRNRRLALQKIGTIAVGTLVAVSFAEAAAIMPKILPALQDQQMTQELQLPVQQPLQSNAQPTGTKLGNLANIPPSSAFYFVYPPGNSNILIRLRDGSLVAYSSTCTHQPCTVGYDNASGLIKCPCHGAVFDPAHAAMVLQGPAPSPLPSVRLTIDNNGDVWLA